MTRDLKGAGVLLTGASSGIGASLARRLAAAGARLALVSRREAQLESLAGELRATGAEAVAFATDLSDPAAASALAARAGREFGAIDILINNAGTQRFRMFADEELANMDRLYRLNLLAPMILTQALLPDMLARGAGRIVNIGSAFGSLAFPGFSLYAATKFGLRGWSEALRRELAGTGVRVTYVAPRAARTEANDPRVYRLNARLKVAMDDPDVVARAILRAIRNNERERYVGWPEKLFVRVNALLPGVVDRTLGAKLPTIREHAALPDLEQ